MNRSRLLAATSILALCAGCAFASNQTNSSSVRGLHPYQLLNSTKLLYNQNSNNSQYPIDSQNFSGVFSSNNDQAADDFVIPKGQTWSIVEVDVTGAYFNGYGPANSENVIFYKNRKGMPGAPVKNGTFTDLNGTGGPDFTITLPGRGLSLQSGKYWVSVIANLDFDAGGEWGWQTNSTQHRRPAMWQNPKGGFGICQSWGTIGTCVGSPAPDLMFELRGTVK